MLHHHHVSAPLEPHLQHNQLLPLWVSTDCGCFVFLVLQHTQREHQTAHCGQRWHQSLCTPHNLLAPERHSFWRWLANGTPYPHNCCKQQRHHSFFSLLVTLRCCPLPKWASCFVWFSQCARALSNTLAPRMRCSFWPRTPMQMCSFERPR